MRTRVIVAATIGTLALLAIAGCASNEKKPTQKQVVTEKWNSARASVMAGLAKDQFKSGNFEQCRKTVDEALALNPKDAQLHMLSAKLAIEQGQLELAEKELVEARALAPGDGEAYYLSGVIYQRWQRPQTAYEFYSGAAERSPAELAYVLAQAEMLVNLDRAPEALSMLKDRVVYFEHSPAIRDAAGRLLSRTGNHAEAAEMFRQASVLGEDDKGYRERLGLEQYYAGQYPEAAETLSKLTTEEPFASRPDLLTALGEAQLLSNRARDARDTFEHAISFGEGTAHLNLAVARASIECNDLKRAELAIHKAQTIAPASAEPYLLSGYLQLRRGRMKEALTAFQRASVLDRSDTVSVCMAGYVLQQAGKHDQAMQCYGRALKMNPSDEMATKLMAGVDLND